MIIFFEISKYIICFTTVINLTLVDKNQAHCNLIIRWSFIEGVVLKVLTEVQNLDRQRVPSEPPVSANKVKKWVCGPWKSLEKLLMRTPEQKIWVPLIYSMNSVITQKQSRLGSCSVLLSILSVFNTLIIALFYYYNNNNNNNKSSFNCNLDTVVNSAMNPNNI